MRLLVGGPVRDRSWIMPDWFAHVETACHHAGLVPGYVFGMGEGDESLDALDADVTLYRSITVVDTGEPEGETVERGWHDQARLRHMVTIRNLVLAEVRRLAPDLFLSLDSDILLHPQALVEMVESTERFGAVGGATFMSATGEEFPNCGWVEGMTGFSRHYMEHAGVIPVGVIMAAKLMTPAAYNVDYTFSLQGEDIGWSVAAGEAGVRLGWDSRHVSKHVMSAAALEPVDARCGF